MEEENALTVPGRFDQIRTIIDFVLEGAQAAGLDEHAMFHLELCCDEASTNIIEHAYGAEDLGTITVQYETTTEAFSVTFLDHGRPFSPEDIPEPGPFSDVDNKTPPALSEFLDSLKIGGLGIHLMRKLMDDVQYSFSIEDGNRLTLVKYIDEGSEQ
jgi:anti-sigma regulatory factor (Ser/Thr protein kinase)